MSEPEKEKDPATEGDVGWLRRWYTTPPDLSLDLGPLARDRQPGEQEEKEQPEPGPEA